MASCVVSDAAPPPAPLRSGSPPLPVTSTTAETSDDRAKSVPILNDRPDTLNTLAPDPPKPTIAASDSVFVAQARSSEIKIDTDIKPALPTTTKASPSRELTRVTVSLPDDCARRLQTLAIRHPKVLADLGITRLRTGSGAVLDVAACAARQTDDWLRVTPTTSYALAPAPIISQATVMPLHHHTVHASTANAAGTPMETSLPRPGSDESRVESGLGSSRASSDNNTSQVSIFARKNPLCNHFTPSGHNRRQWTLFAAHQITAITSDAATTTTAGTETNATRMATAKCSARQCLFGRNSGTCGAYATNGAAAKSRPTTVIACWLIAKQQRQCADEWLRASARHEISC